MNRVSIKKDVIEIKIDGMDILWAMKKSLIIPKTSVMSVYVKPDNFKAPVFRFPGTYIPKIILSGTYYGKNRKEFWSSHFKDAIVFELKNYKYNRVVIDVKNPQKIIDELKK